ncbi:Sodium-dependent noradrenaline transporter [Portunus trituberculatus]|uniref:Sodium-dependent noradrenaline transporter n=1 Tax=Portunus trituberculatus TaxID=210409 RepID=A0A5B7HGJ9_PORTR|nr:Sodium-dependent noradrenaline transporter [Portunus trituberculatus]
MHLLPLSRSQQTLRSRGIGYAMFMISFYIGCYYNVVLSWAIYYIYSSFTHTLPWTSCGDEWRSECK